MKSLIKAAVTLAATIFALCFAQGQNAVNAVNITSKCENCPPQYRVNVSPVKSVSYNGNVDSDQRYPSHVEITNAAVMSVDGTRFVKFKQFGLVLNYPSRFINLYWVKGVDKRFDYSTSAITLHPLQKGALRYHESLYIKGVGELKIFFCGKTGNVVGYSLEHWDFPDASGQMVTREGLVTEY